MLQDVAYFLQQNHIGSGKKVLDTLTLGHLVCFIVSVKLQVLMFAKSSTQEKQAVSVFYNYETKLILEQQEFKLCESTYMWTFSVNTLDLEIYDNLKKPGDEPHRLEISK